MRTKVIIRDNQFDKATREKMWSIYRSYYNYSKAEFMARIARNNYYSLYLFGDEIIGFTGLKIDKVKIESRRVFLIYFGQTIITNDFRGKSLIPVTGFKLFLKFWRNFLFNDMYFWADTLCYKPYLVFAKTLEEYYPSYQRPNPGKVNEVIQFIGEQHYKGSFDKATGTVIKDQNLVRDPSAVIRDKDLLDPDIRFYQKANPNHGSGRGLITLGPGNLRNLNLLLTRFLKYALLRRPAKRWQRAFNKARG